MTLAKLKTEFTREFGSGGRLHVIRAPGRVNLIGEHTDYNEGFVFPMAIEPQIFFVCRPRTDGKVVVKSSLFPGSTAEMSLSGRITKGEPKWSNYVRGPIALLLAKGVPLVGMDCLIINTLPMGGGLSSSAAMEVGTVRAMLTLAGESMDESALAQLCQKAEHDFADVPCGIMDQTIVVSGKADHAMLLDCRDLSRRFVPLDKDELTVVVTNSMVKHELSGGEYAERRQQCEEAVRYFGKTDPAIRALRDVTREQLETGRTGLSDVVFRRARHVVGENERCLKFAECLTSRRYEQAGQLMLQSHESLRDDYEVSVPEIDFLVQTAMNLKGVYGSRMTGGGFGGCTVSLVQPRFVESFVQEIRQAYQSRFRIEAVVFATHATDGAGVLE
ncbi:MAG: galactokinase [Phycisphaerae bacterium]|jgi:galactokinase|nr:MAG: galactokinase [Phycisphaerae bacterium]